MKLYNIILHCMIYSFVTSIEIQSLNKLMLEFGIRNPLIFNHPSHQNAIKLIKELSDNNQLGNSNSLHFMTKNMKLGEVDVVIYVEGSKEMMDYIKVFLKGIINNKAVIICKNEIREDLKQLELNIGQEVYFYIKATSEVYEFYTVNGLKVKRKLGSFDDLDNRSFKWMQGINQNILKRRSDFFGTTLKAMVDPSPEAVILQTNYMDIATYFPENQTYLVNGLVKGSFFNILEALQHQLNFTTNLYQRHDRSLGFVNDWKNGTITATGMVGDIYFKKADIILHGLHMVYERALYIEFLPPLQPFRRSLFIPTHASSTAYKLDTYLGPFRPQLWMMIFVSIIFISVFNLVFQLKNKQCHNLSKITLTSMTLVWSSIKSLFGGRCSGKWDPNTSTSYKLMLFMWSLFGTLIWICYRSQLTAIFSASHTTYPFQDLESLAETNWR